LSTDRGNAIVSTLRLSDPIAVELPGERQRRVAIFAKLWLPSQDASLCSVGVVHLDALGAPTRLWLFGTTFMRELQVKALAPLFPESDLVVGADLNTWHGRQEPALRFLGKLLGTPVSIVRGPGIRVLDYLFFRLRPDVIVHGTVAANDYGSDHHPLVVQVVSDSSP
jgi:endonuclease/exonuclease/phosphatase family metal-dependent hydrolase